MNGSIRTLGAVVLAGALLTGCAGMTPTEQRVLSGGAIGAGGGAVLGAIGGDAALGAILGGAAGLAGGYLWDQHKQAEADAYYRGYNDGRRPPPRRR
ncbi:hypothetical protein [Stella sp.]|uniref:hypothetical protein n=1 Tax=Stella sp. TaxID=2912054 RepID=UPI0035B4CB31